MERWTLAHPTFGLIEVERGYDVEFLQQYEDWPGNKTNPAVEVGAKATLKERVEAWKENPHARIQIKVDGKPCRRIKGIPKRKAAVVEKDIEVFGDRDEFLAPGAPYLKFTSTPLGEIIGISFHNKGEVVELDPPAGSRGAKVQADMAESPIKRVMYPLLLGLGKSGWAIAMLVLVPWISGLLPDIDVKLPEVKLPTFPSPPHIALPYPTIHLPQLPALPPIPELPDWVKMILEHSNIWFPLVVGIFVGLLALRNHKKSERAKQKWEAEQSEAQSGLDTPEYPRS
ncbi:hypothetical protein [Corynebacterium sp. H130]|uniref:hypothetical protein n=1 Tax=Corynebacterium sp. H130 TaxID=3133444 RepID=UPI0030AEBAED